MAICVSQRHHWFGKLGNAMLLAQYFQSERCDSLLGQDTIAKGEDAGLQVVVPGEFGEKELAIESEGEVN